MNNNFLPCVADKLFDPVELTKKTEKVVMQGNKRKYFRFGTTPDYNTGIATGYAVGCNLRCAFCWAHETRDDLELAKDFYSPEEVFDKLKEIVRQNPQMDKIRISDGEPTIGYDHLLELIELTEKSDIRFFFIESNGVLLGHNKDYVKELSKFKKLFTRVSIKAGTPEDFSRKTGAVPESFMLPFQGIRYLKEYKMDFGVAAMSVDPRFMTPLERVSLFTRLGEIDPELILKLEEEMTILFPTAKKRLKSHGWNTDHVQLPFFLRGPLKKYVQMSYASVHYLKRHKISYFHTLKNIIQLRHGI